MPQPNWWREDEQSTMSNNASLARLTGAILGMTAFHALWLASPILAQTAEPSLEAADLSAQAALVEISEIQLQETVTGFALRLTTLGELPPLATSVIGNAAIVDIPNAVLSLTAASEFTASDPAEGIARVSVTSLPNNQVRIAITGATVPPIVELSSEAAGLSIGVMPGSPVADTEDDSAIQIVVTGETEAYLAPNASTATRTDTPILDIPQSVQVVPQQVLEDQQIIRVDEALRNVSGIIGRLNPFAASNLTIRGFTANNFTAGAILRDGFRINDNLSTQETANVERIEVIKGPASVLYGQNDPGGIINLVTKRPLARPFYEFEFQAGSDGLLRPS
ncbi:MAG: TonB-dependent receptor, partial [Leptolyngbya sp. SIO4C5]|nr:TonB-dependent receptor [Leptolyngbya sp. SIO4C5]